MEERPQAWVRGLGSSPALLQSATSKLSCLRELTKGTVGKKCPGPDHLETAADGALLFWGKSSIFVFSPEMTILVMSVESIFSKF